MYGVLDRRDNLGPREVPIFVEGAGGRSSGRIVGEVCGVDPEGVPVQFLPVAESDRTETAAQTFPHGDTAMVSGEDLLNDGARRFQQLVDQERQHHQQHQHRGQMLVPVSDSSWERPCWTGTGIPSDQLSDLYHARWGIEELYKVSKQLMEVEDFHGQSERGVKQELYACFTLIAMTRLFANHGEDHQNGRLPNDGKPLMQTNFKHGLAAVAANIESLLLQHASALRETVTRIVGEIVRCRHRLRPGRSYERRSRKPVGKWQRGRGTLATTTR